MAATKPKQTTLAETLAEFFEDAIPQEAKGHLTSFTDKRTGANYCECHVKASKLVNLGTTDVPLDPEEQAEYRANREIVSNHVAFQKMKDDARKGRAFSNIVAEYSKIFD